MGLMKKIHNRLNKIRNRFGLLDTRKTFLNHRQDDSIRYLSRSLQNLSKIHLLNTGSRYSTRVDALPTEDTDAFEKTIKPIRVKDPPKNCSQEKPRVKKECFSKDEESRAG